MTGVEKLEVWRRGGLFLTVDPALAARLGRELDEQTVEEGQLLFRRGDPSDATYMIVSGAVEVVVQSGDEERAIDVLRPGEPVGELQLLAGGMRTATARCCEKSLLIRLGRPTFESAAADAPELIREMTELIRARLKHYRLEAVLPHVFRSLRHEVIAEIERDATWIRLRRGDLLFRQGESDRSLCVLVRGRLQAEVESAGVRRVVGQILPGESVGEMALFTGEARSASVYAARDSEVISLSRDEVAGIATRHPELVMEMTRIVIRRLRQSIGGQTGATGAANIVLLPTSADFPLDAFARALSTALAQPKVLRLSSEVVNVLLGTPGISTTAEDDPNAMRLEVWLDEQESAYTHILYEPDPTPTAWSLRCIRRADQILLLGDAAASPEPGEIENTLLAGEKRTLAPRTLVLVHDSGAALPTGTRAWLAARSAEGCVHLRKGRDADFARLGRILTGRAVGVVLSGGGAKGFAHIGVLRALEERGIPVDMIGGTSMGSVIGAAYAMGIAPREITETSKRLFATHRPFKEYTIPLISIFRGRRLDRMLREQFGDTRIEDLWIGFFCVSADLTAAEARVHTSDSLFTAVRSSISIPGVLPPVIVGDRLLVDGGIVNNLPGDVMRARSRGTLIAVDVAPERDVEIGEGLGDYPSPWQVLLNRLRPTGSRRSIPGIPQILFRTTMLGSIQRGHEVKSISDHYLRPPVEAFGMLQFEAIDAIVEAGYHNTVESIAGWAEPLPGAPAGA